MGPSSPVTIETTLKPEGPALLYCSVIVRYDLNSFSVNEISRLRIRITLQDSVTKGPINLVTHEFEDTPSQDFLLPGSILVQRDLGAAMAQELHDQISRINARYALFVAPRLGIPNIGMTSGQFVWSVELIRPTLWDTVFRPQNGSTMWVLKEWEVLATDNRAVLSSRRAHVSDYHFGELSNGASAPFERPCIS